MQFVGEEPMPVAELERQARTPTNLDGMRRWGYVSSAPRIDSGPLRSRGCARTWSDWWAIRVTRPGAAGSLGAAERR